MSLPCSSTMAAEDAEKAESAARVGRGAGGRGAPGDPAPRTSSPGRRSRTAISVAMALGGSTNAVLHLLAIAHSAGVPLALDDFEAIRARVPVLCDLKPSGRYVATDLHARRRRAAGHEDAAGPRPAAWRRADRSPARPSPRRLRDVPAEPRADQDVIRPWARPLYAQGHLAVLRGNLAPEGAVAKITGVKEPRITGPARVFESEEACLDAILDGPDPAGRRPGDPLRGAAGRAGDAGDAGADLGDHRRGAGRLGRADHRRTLLGRHLRAGGGPRRARGGGRRADRAGRGGRPASPSTPTNGCSPWTSARTSWPGGATAWTPPRARATPPACCTSTPARSRARAWAR